MTDNVCSQHGLYVFLKSSFICLSIVHRLICNDWLIPQRTYYGTGSLGCIESLILGLFMKSCNFDNRAEKPTQGNFYKKKLLHGRPKSLAPKLTSDKVLLMAWHLLQDQSGRSPPVPPYPWSVHAPAIFFLQDKLHFQSHRRFHL